MMSDGPGRVCAVLPTPFAEDESVAVDDIVRLVEWEMRAGVDSVAVLGFAGEVLRLRDHERVTVLRTTLDAVGGSAPVIAGVAGYSVDAICGYAAQASDLGAAALLVPVPVNSTMSCADMVRYFSDVAEAAGGIPIVLQDEPENTGVKIPASSMVAVFEGVPAVRWSKVEQPPCAAKIAAVGDALSRDDVALYGGRGGLEIIDELINGSAGVMTGFAYPELLVSIIEHWNRGDTEKAVASYRRVLPALLFESQPGIGLAIRKQSLCNRGAISSPTVRRPGARLSPEVLRRLDFWNAAVEN